MKSIPKKKLILLIITITFIFVMIIGATYAYLQNFDENNLGNIEATANIGNHTSVFSSTGGNIILNVTALDVSNFNTDSTTNIRYMFSTTPRLTSIIASASKWNAATVLNDKTITLV